MHNTEYKTGDPRTHFFLLYIEEEKIRPMHICCWARIISLSPSKRIFLKLTRHPKAEKELFLEQISLSDLRLDTFELN